MTRSNAFSSSNRNQMGSNYLTDVNQGGGDKKAGFPYIIGRDSWFGHYYTTTSLKKINTTIFPLARQSRPISSAFRSNYRNNKIPGTA